MSKLLELVLPPACLVLAFATAFLVFVAPPFVLTAAKVNSPEGSIASIEAASYLTQVPSREMLIDFDERPLFTPARTPAREELGERPITPIGFSVVGIFVSNDDAVTVIRQKNKEQVRLRIGESIEGWTVVSVQAKSVVFENRGLTREIELTKPGE